MSPLFNVIYNLLSVHVTELGKKSLEKNESESEGEKGRKGIHTLPCSAQLAAL